MFNHERDIKVYTADIEKPSCIQCDRQTVEEELCEKYCGSEHGWGMYIRFEVVEDG